MRLNRNVESAWWALRIGLGMTAFLAGLDKFFNVLANWSVYVSPLAERMVPLSVPTLLHAVGVIEMVVGIAVLTSWTRLGAYIAMVWLIAISVNLVLSGRFFDVAVRDVVMAIAAYTLAQLSELRESAATSGTTLTNAIRATPTTGGRAVA